MKLNPIKANMTEVNVKDQYCAGPQCDCDLVVAENRCPKHKPIAADERGEGLPEHTPTPWKMFKNAHGYGVGKDNSLTEIFYFDNEMKALEKWMELTGNYAIHIVRAVNSHEVLLNAVQAALNSEYINPDGSRIPVIFNGELRTMLEEALALAEGK